MQLFKTRTWKRIKKYFIDLLVLSVRTVVFLIYKPVLMNIAMLVVKNQLTLPISKTAVGVSVTKIA